MKALPGFLTLFTFLSFLPGAEAQEVRTVQVQFEKGRDNAVVTGKVTGREAILYKLNARDGQFLSVSLRPDNQSANYNIYIPGRGPGDEALFTSDLGGREYMGQLYKTGDHTISVFLNRAAARRGDVANFDIVFRITDQPAGPLPAEMPPTAGKGDAPAGASPSPADGNIALKRMDHAPLLERQAALPVSFSRKPVSLALLVIEPGISGVVTSVDATYDTTESPSEVEVVINEGGILDDDLFGIRHVISLLRNSNDEWRVVEYATGELRRGQ